MILSILVYTFFSRMFDLMLPPVAKHSIVDGKGYYIASNIEEALAYRAYNRSYWKSGIEKDRGIARCMERKFFGQTEMNFEE